MDKTWIQLDNRVSLTYLRGVSEFIDFAFKRVTPEGNILCPCVKCCNAFYLDKQTVRDHLVCHGFLTGYTKWICHGESEVGPELTSSSSNPTYVKDYLPKDPMGELLHDIQMSHIPQQYEESHSGVDTPGHGTHPQQLQELIKDASKELYPGCSNFSKLSFIVRLFHLKCSHGWSNKAFTGLLEMLNLALPPGVGLPKSAYETKKHLRELGLGYKKIHACPNNCMLYWKEKENDEACSQCGLSRWKNEGSSRNKNHNLKKKPAKVLRYFPLIPRLQRLFASSKIASDMKWHEEGRNKDGLLRHPADSKAWADFATRYPQLSADPRNIWLGLAADGFNPFRSMNVNHSTWPVVLIPYYDSSKPLSFHLSHVPDQVDASQWAGIVSYWNSKEGKETSATNSVNRSKQKMPHTLGKRSYAVVIDQIEAETGTKLTRDDVFILGHQRKKDKTPVNDEAAQAIADMKTIREVYPDLATSSISLKEDIVSRVLGPDKSGRVRCFGIGPRPIDFATSSSRHLASKDSSNENEKDKEIERLKKKMEKLEAAVEILLEEKKSQANSP